MKIQSLLELIQVNRDHRKSQNQFKDDLHNERRMNRVSDASDKKTGFYGRVYDKEQPHTLTKANYVSEDPKNDPYLIYINYIADNNIASENPFVPRVYEIKTLEDVRGRVKYKIEIERLKRLEELPEEVIVAMTNNLFYPEQIRMYKDRFSTPPMILAKCIEMVCRQRLESKDNLLNAAGAIVNRIKKSNNRFDYDVHKGNIMVRLSPAPQVVIVDPLSQESTTSYNGG